MEESEVGSSYLKLDLSGRLASLNTSLGNPAIGSLRTCRIGRAMTIMDNHEKWGL